MLFMCDFWRPFRASASLLIAAGIVSGCNSAPPVQRRQAVEARVPVVAATIGSVTPRSTLGGLIVPFQNVQITTTLVEPAAAVYVQEGDHVTRGEVLARLDTTDLAGQLQSYLGTAASDEANTKKTALQAGLTIAQNNNSIDAAKASLQQTQQTLATDTLNLTRDQQLLKSGYLAQQTVDAQQTLVANDQQAVRTAQVNLQNTVAQVQANGTVDTGLQGATVAAAKAAEQTALGLANQIRAQIARATIVSPVDGIVVNRNLNPGEYPGTRQIFTLQETDRVFAVLNGGAGEIVGVRQGSPVNIVSTDSALLQGRARVSAVLDQVVPGSTNFVVKAVMPNPGGLFRSGMVVTGVVQRPTLSGVRIPRTAFVDDSQSSVESIAQGKVKTLQVTMIAEDAKNAVVQGLRPGQRIIMNGQLGLTDGQSVMPAGKRSAPGQQTVAER
jgi:multidrug efflux pump subunit AcrA (membrane-fusion protein)